MAMASLPRTPPKHWAMTMLPGVPMAVAPPVAAVMPARTYEKNPVAPANPTTAAVELVMELRKTQSSIVQLVAAAAAWMTPCPVPEVPAMNVDRLHEKLSMALVSKIGFEAPAAFPTP